MSKKVLTNIDADGNATVLLNRPDAHNAFDPEMVDALTTAFRKLGADPKVRAVVLTGAGKSFCAGADIAHMKKSARFSRERNLADAHAAATMLHALYSMDKPTIACVRGAVRGGGLGLVAACDIAIAERTCDVPALRGAPRHHSRSDQPLRARRGRRAHGAPLHALGRGVRRWRGVPHRPDTRRVRGAGVERDHRRPARAALRRADPTRWLRSSA